MATWSTATNRSPFPKSQVIYFFFPETARLSLEEIAKKFGEEVVIDVTAATEEEQKRLNPAFDHSYVMKLKRGSKPGSQAENNTRHVTLVND